VCAAGNPVKRRAEHGEDQQMNMAKVKQGKPQMRTIVFTVLWLVLLGAAMAFIAIAGHV
jgi:hypothetical protein